MKLADNAADRSCDDLLEELLDEIAARLKSGDKVDVEDYAARHPEIAQQLRDMFPAMQLLAEAGVEVSDEMDPEQNKKASSTARELGDFQLIQEIGRGGMGVVYKAAQLSLGRHVALKVLPFAATMDPRQLQRFKNESMAAASLDHPHIVDVYGVGCERGVHYYAMRLIEGNTLAEVVAQLRQLNQGDQPLPDSISEAMADVSNDKEQASSSRDVTEDYPQRAMLSRSDIPNDEVNPNAAKACHSAQADTKPKAQAAISTKKISFNGPYFRSIAEAMIHVAEALDSAHEQGVIHRDIKPSNLMIDGTGKVWITDFGLAQVESSGNLTMTGDLIGTLRYMSPEQALAKRAPVDHRTDIYSLGATLYELLTLRPAFAGDDQQELLRQISFEEPVSPQKINRSIPADLATIASKAMEKNSADRYATANEMAEDLRRYLENEPIKAKRPSLAVRSRKWARRHPTLVWSSIVLLITVALSSMIAALFFADLAKRNANLVEDKQAALKEAKEQTQTANAINKFLNKLLRQAEVGQQLLARGPGDPDVKVRTLLDRAANEIDEQFREQPLTEAAIRYTLGHAYVALGEFTKAQRHLARSALLRSKHLGAGHVETLRSKNTLAEAYTWGGKVKKAISLLEETLKVGKAQFGKEHRDTLMSQQFLAEGYYLDRQFAKAISLLERTLKVRKAKFGNRHHSTLATQNSLAHVYRVTGKLDKAHSMLEQTFKASKAELGAGHPLTIAAQSNLADTYTALGQPEKAIALHMEALEASKASSGSNHPYTLAIQSNLALAYEKAGQLDQAIQLYDLSLERSKTKLGNDHPATLTSQFNLARAYQADWQWNKAIPLFEEMLRLRKAKDGENHPQVLRVMEHLLFSYESDGRYEDAVGMWEDYCRLKKSDLARRRLIYACALAGEADKAIELGKLYLEDARQTTPHDDAKIADALEVNGRVRLKLMLWSQAEPFLRESLALRDKVTPDDWRRFSTMSLVGTALLGQGKLDEAEPLLQSGFAGIKARANQSAKASMGDGVTWNLLRIIQIYKAAKQPQQVKLWEKEIAAWDPNFQDYEIPPQVYKGEQQNKGKQQNTKPEPETERMRE